VTATSEKMISADQSTSEVTVVEVDLIRDLKDYRAVEDIQRDAWRLEEVEIVPDHVLITAQKNGGLVLGAFEPCPEGGRWVVGFAFGFAGFTPEGALKHCSHMVGVAPSHQNRGVGYLLKVAQREYVLAQGLELITWTFDPLESRNANLNFRKLGGTCSQYLRDIYGDMRDELNSGLPSDRFQVAWYIATKHVAERLQREAAPASRQRGPTISQRLASGVKILNRFLPAKRPRPPQSVLPVEGEEVLIQIPAHFQDVRATDIALARAWRQQTRTLFETAFARGYTVVDLLFEQERSCYRLVKDWKCE